MELRSSTTRPFRMLFALLMLFGMLAGLFAGPVKPALAAANDLFFSEYIEGSSNNKALEIYNGTGAAINLATDEYNVQMYFNGSTNPGLTINLTGTVAPGDVFVLAHSSAAAQILDQADQTNSAGWFNGDDAVVLRKGATVLDVIGQIGVDPGTEWGSGLASTTDNTLRRKTAICAGDPDGSNAFDPNVEWDGFAQDTFGGLGSHTATCDGATEPQISEVRVDQTGADDDEYFELSGSAGTDLSDLTYIVIGDGTGGVGVIEAVVSLAGQSIPASGFFVVAESTFTLGTADFVTDLNFENSDSVTHLLVRGFSGSNGQDLDTDNDGTLDLTPWSDLVSAVGLLSTDPNDRVYTSVTVGPEGNFLPGHVYRCEDGFRIGAFDPNGGDDTPGAPNPCDDEPPPPPVELCEATDLTITRIHTIQGTGASSPMIGQEVVIEGIVVGDFQAGDGDATDLAGFYVQEEDADADANPDSSEGIYIFDLNAPTPVNVQAGDLVRVRGVVGEFQAQTQISLNQANSAMDVCASGQGGLVTATTLSFPLPDGQEGLERYEGMYVTIDQPMIVNEYFNLDRFGQVDVATERLEQPTDVAEPGPASDAVLAYNEARRIRLDDGSQTQNPFPVTLPDGQLEYADSFGGGDTLSNITGVLSWIRPGIFTNAAPERWTIQLTELPTFENTLERPADPPAVGGNLTIAGFNVLNYFNTLNSRGATTPEELIKQEAKIVAALAAIDADVFGLIEIENNFAAGPNSAVARLVNALNDAVGAGTYAYIDPGANVGTDVISVAIIYKPGTVTPVGSLAILDDPAFVNPFGANEDRNRPALAQTFEENASGAMLTVVVNHLKSKGSGCGPGDDDPRQGNCNLTRAAAAQALVDWLASDPTGSGDPDFLLLGDYNAYAKEDPIDVLKAGGYTDLLDAFQSDEVYTYVFNGQTGYLDYGLASASLLPQVTGAAPWNINSDEPGAYEYEENFDHPSNLPLWYAPTPYRSSDHDPVIVGLNLAPTGGSIKVTKIVELDGLTPPDPSFTICITGPSYPSGNCQQVSAATGGDLIWSDLEPGSYSIAEQPSGDEWSVSYSTQQVEVVAGQQATATITNKLCCLYATDISLGLVRNQVVGTVIVTYSDGYRPSNVEVTVEWTTPKGVQTQTVRTDEDGVATFGVQRRAGTFTLRVLNISDAPNGEAAFCADRGVTQASLQLPH